MIFKGCLRCRGDVYTEDDLGGHELVCLQCGHRVPEGSLTTVAQLDGDALLAL